MILETAQQAAAAAVDLILSIAAEHRGDVHAVRRALSVENQGHYGLGCGGRDPAAPSPFSLYQPRKGEAEGLTKARRAKGKVWSDCSGALSWFWGESRKDTDDGEDEIDGDWFACDSLYADAVGPRRFVRSIAAAELVPGDGLVYPGRWVAGRRVAIGHCSMVIWRPAVVRCFADVLIVHCHGPSGTGPAITRAHGALWDRKGGVGLRRVRR